GIWKRAATKKPNGPCAFIIDQPPPMTSSFPFATRAKSAIMRVTFMTLAALQVAARLNRMSRGAYLLDLGLVPYQEAWDLQRSLAGAVSQGAIPDTVVFLEHPPVVTLGRRADAEALHVPEGAGVDVVETDRGGKSTFHGPGQFACYPILDLHRHGRDVRKYGRDLEESVVQTLAAFGLEGQRIEGLTGVWLSPPPRKIASIGVHIS